MAAKFTKKFFKNKEIDTKITHRGAILVEIWDWGGKGAQELLAGFSLQPLKEIP